MVAVPAFTARARSGMPSGLRVLIALGLPFFGAVTVVGIYLNKEFIVAAAWVAFSVAGSVLIQPMVGVLTMTAMFLLAAYPSPLQDLGVLTISNLLGVCLAVVLAAYVLRTRDLSFLVTRQVLVLLLIGLLLVLSTAHANVIFPTLQASQSLGVKGKLLDRTSDMMHDFWARLGFLVFFCAFVRSRRDLSATFLTFMLALFLAVPSALIDWWNGNLSHGFRAVASVTAGTNANRLAMICLMEMACWWFWLHRRPGPLRGAIASAAIGGALLVVLATGSRSGLIGLGVLAALLQTSPRRYRASTAQLTAVALAGVIAVLTIVPPEAWQRMLSFSTDDPHAIGASSLIKREDTIQIGMQMIRDHPFLGIGLGNYREVSRQVYLDEYFRPPHNSFIWAASEGGMLVLGSYLLLWFVTWRELQMIMRYAAREPQLQHVAAALRVMFLLYVSFAALADLWLNPITYVLIGSIICMRRYLERLPAVAPVVVLPAPRMVVARRALAR